MNGECLSSFPRHRPVVSFSRLALKSPGTTHTAVQALQNLVWQARFLSLLPGFASSLGSFKSFPLSLAKSYVFILKHLLCVPFPAPLLLMFVLPGMTSALFYPKSVCLSRSTARPHPRAHASSSLITRACPSGLLTPLMPCAKYSCLSLRFCISLAWEVISTSLTSVRPSIYPSIGAPIPH